MQKAEGKAMQAVIPSAARNLALVVPERESARDSLLRSLKDHVIPAKAGIHCVPYQQWTPAFAGVTTYVIFIPLGGPQANDPSE